MKKNQFALIFLTLIVMLAVWYIKSPIHATDKGNTGNDDTTLTTSGRLDAIKAMRDALREERSVSVASLDAIIASADTSISEKEAALLEKQAISNLTEKEILLEVQIMNLGYSDAFVHASSAGVEVIVISDTEDATVALEIIQNVMVSFDDAEDVVVNFKTADELARN